MRMRANLSCGFDIILKVVSPLLGEYFFGQIPFWKNASFGKIILLAKTMLAY